STGLGELPQQREAEAAGAAGDRDPQSREGPMKPNILFHDRSPSGEGDCSNGRGPPPRRPADWRKVEGMDETDNPAGHLPRNLAALRQARSLTQAALAKAAGLPRSTIANLESGEGNPSLQVLTKVARSLGVPLDELLAGPRAKTRLWSEADMPKETRGRGVTV